MLTGQSPFVADELRDTIRMVSEEEASFPDTLAAGACSLVRGLLMKDPKKRLGAEEVKTQDWFQPMDWQAMARRECSAPWIPPVSSAMDTSMFEKCEGVKDSDDAISAEIQSLFDEWPARLRVSL